MQGPFELSILRGRAITETPMVALTSTYPLWGIGFRGLKLVKLGETVGIFVAIVHPSGSGGLQSRRDGGSTTVLSDQSPILN